MNKRAPLNSDLKLLREELLQLLPILEAMPGWYASVYLERRASQTFSANLKQTQVSDQISMGAVLRIYNGYTLFEQATDDLETESLKSQALKFAERVAHTAPAKGANMRIYTPDSWQTRLKSKLDPELSLQIPENPTAKTPVHFGIQFSRDPKAFSTESYLTRLKGIVERFRFLAPQCGLTAEDLSFIVARESFSEEEAIFIDRETNMSQTLYRIALTMIAMSGAERGAKRMGGLGGLETTDYTDKDLMEILKNLKDVKTAERLKPGKYRVLFGPVVTGVLAHEAFGHAQEADTCARGRSKAWELHKTGELVGNLHATILNNPAVFQNGDQPCAAWGSYFFDEEGWLSREQVLLDQGKLTAPMTNLTSALRLGIPRSANGKRESWSNGVYTRQTNTYFSAGDQTLDELMAKIDYGFVGTEAAGGMEDPKGMGIQVGVQFLREVKDGKFTGKVFKGPAGGDIQLTGYVPDVLNSILGKSKIEFNSKSPDKVKYPFNDAGGCGKYHKEFVFAGCGGPYLLLDQAILG